MKSGKPRIIKDFEKLSQEVQEQIKLAYPEGFSDHLITFPNKDGNLVSALPFETEDIYYMVKMTVREAIRIIEEDDDYDSDGMLKDDVKDEYESRHVDLDDIADELMADDD